MAKILAVINIKIALKSDAIKNTDISTLAEPEVVDDLILNRI
jgi:hypothetical protein